MSVCSQALARNTRMPTINLCYAAGGPWTESFFYESAAFLAASVASGVSAQSPHPARAIYADHVTPLEMRVNAEVELACTGMTRKEASRIVAALLDEYEAGLATASKGKNYAECFDLASGEPRPEYVEFVSAIQRDLSAYGIGL